jgi:pimeloyl-ACP methyl ester carboxylesterase
MADAAIRPITAPTLVIWGEGDRYLGPELAEPDHDDVPGLDRVRRARPPCSPKAVARW